MQSKWVRSILKAGSIPSMPIQRVQKACDKQEAIGGEKKKFKKTRDPIELQKNSFGSSFRPLQRMRRENLRSRSEE